MNDQELNTKLDKIESAAKSLQILRGGCDDLALIRALGDIERAAVSASYRMKVLTDWRPWTGRMK